MPTIKRPLPKAVCEHCKFVLKTKGTLSKMYCRRYPPTLVSMTQGGAYPEVYANDWCGEFSRTMMGQQGHGKKK